MINILIVLTFFLSVIVWIVAIVIDNLLYLKRLYKLKNKPKKKKNIIEFKWPEHLPHHDL